MNVSKALLGLVILSNVSQVFCQDAEDQLAPPKYEMLDEFMVNLVSLQPTITIQTTSIGSGDLGLSHSVSTSTSGLSAKPYSTRGFEDKFGGIAKNTELFQNQNQAIRYVMRVFDHEGSMDFEYVDKSNPSALKINIGSPALSQNYDYLPLGEWAHELKVSGANREYLDWIKPDGTITRYYRGQNAKSNDRGYLKEIIYPNGFRITNHYDVGRRVTSSITTNTGFQLKYEYDEDNRRIDPSKDVHRDNVGADSSYWAAKNPKRIVALNAAVEFCDRYSGPRNSGAGKSQCNYANDWPTATFSWPAGMPKVMQVGDNEVSVTDAQGRVSTYSMRGLKDNSELVKNRDYYTPRIMAFKSATSTSPDFHYTYKDEYAEHRYPMASQGYIHTANVLEYASGLKGSNYYVRGPGTLTHHSYHKSIPQTPAAADQHYRSRLLVFNNSALNYDPSVSLGDYAVVPGKLNEARLGEQSLLFESNARNLPINEKSGFNTNSNPKIKYVYNNIRYGFLNEVQTVPSESSTDTEVLVRKARFYREELPNFTCPSLVRKYCNKPMWVQEGDDATRRIYYTYEEQSGQIKSIEYPANEQGVIAKVVYEYDDYRANYYHDDGVKRQSEYPIRLLKSEMKCANSNLVDGVCQGGDSIVTSYEYNHDNLLRTAMVITAKNSLGVTESRRTCYQYDNYGNLIGEIPPAANLSACPN